MPDAYRGEYNILSSESSACPWKSMTADVSLSDSFPNIVSHQKGDKAGGFTPENKASTLSTIGHYIVRMKIN